MDVVACNDAVTGVDRAGVVTASSELSLQVVAAFTFSNNTINSFTTRIPCTNGFDRDRSVGLWAAPTRGRVVLVAPPAETALLTQNQARQLRDKLDELANEVEAGHIKDVAGCVVPSPTAI